VSQQGKKVMQSFFSSSIFVDIKQFSFYLNPSKKRLTNRRKKKEKKFQSVSFILEIVF